MERIHKAGAGFRSLTEAIDTTTAPGRMMMQMVGAFAEYQDRRRDTPARTAVPLGVATFFPGSSST
jgi:DNA invertase Pin-like site-specific DNA recombinase